MEPWTSRVKRLTVEQNRSSSAYLVQGGRVARCDDQALLARCGVWPAEDRRGQELQRARFTALGQLGGQGRVHGRAVDENSA
jgi:hypothetical protein